MALYFGHIQFVLLLLSVNTFNAIMAINEDKYNRFSKVVIPVEFDLSSFSKNLKKAIKNDTKAMVTKTMESREQGMDEITSKHSAKSKEIQNELKVEMNNGFGHGIKRRPTSHVETRTVPIKDHKGKEFITMFPSHDDTSKYALAVQLIITADIPTQVNIYSAYPGVNQTVNITSGVAYVNLPLHITMIPIGRTPTSILIRSDQPVSVVCYSAFAEHGYCAHQDYKCSSYAFNVLPVNSLGMSYNPLMYEYPSIHMGIVATAPYTQVWIEPLETHFKIVDTNIKAMTNRSVTLGYLEGLHLETNDGRIFANVQANNTISLISGNSRNGPFNTDSMYEYMLPNSHWGQYFVMPIMAKVTNVILRITTRSFNTTVNIDDNVRFSKTIVIQSGNAFSIQLSSNVHTVISSQPVLVTIFCKSKTEYS
ncbi:uvrA [Mytilus edulis]|uniref:UvrA n=1 Tax=Mytilus edulis TaxID=6550 RepID=A0A8S3RSR5_MYTED|nr:uvrA [Mytilus edulis]